MILRRWLPVLLMAAGAAIWASQAYREHHETMHSDWPSTTATVVETDVYQTVGSYLRFGGRLRTHAEAVLRYSVAGIPRQARAEIRNYVEPESLVERLPPGATVEIFYDPQAPDRIVFDMGDSRMVFTDLRPLAAALLLVGLVLAGWRLHRPPRAPTV